MALDMKSLTKVKWYYQVGVVLAICGLLFGAGWYYFLSPMQDDITAKQKQLDDLQKEVAKSLQQKKMFEQFKADSIELAKKLDDLKAVLPLEKEQPQIIQAVQLQATSSALKILRIGVRPIIDHEVYTEWPWDMEVVGTYNNVGAFLDRVRQLPRIVNITSLKISSRASEGEQAFTASVGATFTITTFIYHDEPIEATAPPPKPAK